MSDNLKDILSHINPEVDQETLLKYLQGKLSEKEKNEVEKKMLNSDFTDDAMEGLQQFSDKEKLSGMVEQLNREMKKKLQKKKERRDRFRIKDQPWLYITIVIILLLIVLSYIMIQRMMQGN